MTNADASDLAAFDLAPCGLAMLSVQGDFLRVNRAFCAWTGYAREEMVGAMGLADLLGEDGPLFFSRLMQALEAGEPVEEIFLLLHGRDGARAPVFLNAALRAAPPGAPVVALAAFRGEARARHEAELQSGKRAAEHLAAIVAHSTDAIVSIDRDGTVVSANRAFSEIFQYAPQEVLGAQLVELIVPEEARDEFNDRLTSANGAPVLSKLVRRRRKDGVKLDLSLSVAAIHDESGEVAAFSAIYRDVAALMRAAEHIEFLLREVNHRSKNMLAVVQAVARQTARRAPTPEAFIEAFMGRLAAIASSHDLLVSRDWRGVQLGDLTRSQFSHLDEETRARISVGGDLLEINPRAAEAYGLALHELSTNAAKHGALSGPDGKVDLRFALDPATRIYSMSWRESGGPAVAPPERSGFGASVLTRMAPQSIEGEAALEFAPDGVIYRLSAPETAIVMRG
jgi:PAS domain S-box-containing protein